MNKRQNYSTEALFIFVISAIFFVYGLFYIGVFSRYKYFTKTEATTGPNFWVVLGDFKLSIQMPDSIVLQGCGGIMVNEKNRNGIFSFLDNDVTGWEYDYYYVLTGKVIGAEKSDGDAFNPMIEVTESSHISKFLFWILTIVDIVFLIFFGLYYQKTRLTKFGDGT